MSLKIDRKESSNIEYPLCPEGGQAIVLADVIDMGVQTTKWGEKDQLQFRYLTTTTFPDPENGEEKPFMLFERASKSLYDGKGKSPNPSKIYARCKALTGKPPQYDADGKFDVEALIGQSLFADIAHSEPTKDGKVFANIASVMPLPPSMEPAEIPEWFQRQEEKSKEVDDAPPF